MNLAVPNVYTEWWAQRSRAGDRRHDEDTSDDDGGTRRHDDDADLTRDSRCARETEKNADSETDVRWQVITSADPETDMDNATGDDDDDDDNRDREEKPSATMR